MPTAVSKFFRTSLIRSHQLSADAWRTLRSWSPIYLALIVMAGYAAWDAKTPVIVIAPFQMPKADLPFSGDIVADALQDSLKSIHNEIEGEREDPGLRASETGLPDLRNMLIPQFARVQAPPRFAVEVKGVSYERILSVARALMGTQTTVSGDVIVNGKEFILTARTADGGPWESVSVPMSAEGLKRASRDLSEKIVATQDPTLAGVTLLKSGQIDQGLAALDRARKLNPTDARLKLNLCMGLGANRRYEDAIECYQAVLRMKPRFPQKVLEQLAQAYYLSGNRKKAIERYEELKRQGYREALLGLGEALDVDGQHAAALKAYNAFLAEEHVDRELAIAHVKRSATLANLGKHDQALAEYQEALKYAPGDILIMVHRGVEEAKAIDLDTGIARLQSVVDENGNADSIPFAFLQLGILFQEKGDWRRAAVQFGRATERRPNYVEAHLKLAYALAHEGRRPEAIAEYSKVAKLSPDDLERGNRRVLANQWLGNALRDQGDYPGAESAYREAIRLKPDYGSAHCELGLVLERQGHLRQAMLEYRTVLAMAAKSKEVDSTELLVTAHQRLGELLVRQGRTHWAKGTVEFRTALELDPNHLESHLSLGKVLYDEGKFVESGSEYEKAIKIDPQSAVAHNSLGLTLDRQGLVEQASSEFVSAVNLEPANAGYRANLAREVELQHSNKKAVTEHETVARLEL